MEHKFYVYKHTCIFTKKVYIGITSQKPENRWQSGKGYKNHNQYFWNAIQKYGWEEGFCHEILFENLTKGQAEEKEKELIEFYHSNEREFGYNKESGGFHTTCPNEHTRLRKSEGHKGRKMSLETREKIAKANLGRRHSDESKKKMSIAASNRIRTPLSEDTKRKIGEANAKHKMPEEQKELLRKINIIPVEQYSLEGDLIKVFDSITEAASSVGGSKSHISDCCKNKPRYKTAYGYKWKFVEKK